MLTIRAFVLLLITASLVVLGCSPAEFEPYADTQDVGTDTSPEVTEDVPEVDDGTDTTLDTGGTDVDEEVDTEVVVVCGAAGQDCCESDVCDGGLVCNQASCVACGAVGQPCCGANVCDDRLACDQGSCIVDLSPPDPTPCTCPVGAQCFDDRNTGVFFEPSTELPMEQFTYIPTAGVYRRIDITIDVFHAGWDADTANVAHNVFTALRNKSANDLFGEVDFRHGTVSDQVEVLHNLQTPTKQTRTRDAMLSEDHWYRVAYRYDPGSYTMTLAVANLTNDETIPSFTGTTNVGDFTIAGQPNQGTLDISVGHAETGGPEANALTIGWKYANLCVVMTPK